MSKVLVEVLLISLLVVVNGVLAMSEMAVASARKARLRQRADEGDKGARAALELASEPNRFLSTVQVGITLVGILAGAFGGATIAEQLAASLGKVPLLAPYGEAIGIGVVVVCITYLSLVIGELVPKRVALSNAEGIAAGVARPMHLLSQVTFPIVHLLSISTEVVLWLLRVQQPTQPSVTEEEIRILLEQGARQGVFEEAEREIVDRVFLLNDLRIGSFMTPRTEMEQLDLDDPPEENWRKMIEGRHTHFPVYRGDVDKVLGLVSVKDLWSRMITGQSPDLEACLQVPLFVPESALVLQVLDLFKEAGERVALVINEYGGIEGIVTLVDILEAIVGDIPLEDTLPEPQAVQREDGSWLIDGLLPVEMLRETLDLKVLPEEELTGYHTVGGLVMMQMGRIPTATDSFAWSGLRFEVVDMDGYRVDKVLVTPVGEHPPSSD
jgi:putative hemolysin